VTRIFPSITPSWDRDDDPDDLEADSVELSDIYDEDSDDETPEDDE
jgi:hypothetical protein